jgi:uncharacterized protein YndB with AHSA1/START domain
MKDTGSVTITTPSDREIAVRRVFDAPARLVFDAHTKPELIRRWLLGPDGWSMPVCEVDLRVGGKYRYLWRREATGAEMAMGGVFREIVPARRLVATEKFDEAWYPGEAVNTLVLVEEDGRTTLTQTSFYESREARDVALKTGVEEGMKRSYERLQEVLVSLAAA